MLPIRPTNRFRKDLKRAVAQGRNIKKLEKVFEILSIPEPLSVEYQDHKFN
ncbi:MAG: type II toxin-antitoxin system YafQ family toxin [Desulfobacterium sp.]|jgi:mRNA-degrading endonuclease YafQ of YafQ-DinJ toxin-antitoxin module|nr:type II toxin-antitoxin system YafQ family toxin [Desulfobacterium sp.]